MTNKIIVFCTCGSQDEAERIARELVEKRLAACVQISSPLVSFYRWHGEVRRDAEWMLQIKTSEEHFDRVSTFLQSSHSYEVPEILAVPVAQGSVPYLEWMDGELADV